MSSPSSKRGNSPDGTRRVVFAVGAVALLALGVALGSRGGGSGSGRSEQRPGGLAEGTPAPEVRLPSTTGDTVDLGDFRGKRNVLLYFYEHAG